MKAKQILAVAALALCVAKPASATFMYDINTDGILFHPVTHEVFTVPSILTSLTTITTFSLATSSVGIVSSAVLDPVAAGSCPNTVFLGPCLVINIDLGGGNMTDVAFSGFPIYTSVGTFTQGDATITISQVVSVSEPSALLLLIGALGVLFLQIRRSHTAL
jgi:hypothetical protein